jgi:hypothetical protein
MLPHKSELSLRDLRQLPPQSPPRVRGGTEGGVNRPTRPQTEMHFLPTCHLTSCCSDVRIVE